MGFGRFGRCLLLLFRGGGGARRGIHGLVLHLSIINSLRGREGQEERKEGRGREGGREGEREKGEEERKEEGRGGEKEGEGERKS